MPPLHSIYAPFFCFCFLSHLTLLFLSSVRRAAVVVSVAGRRRAPRGIKAAALCEKLSSLLLPRPGPPTLKASHSLSLSRPRVDQHHQRGAAAAFRKGCCWGGGLCFDVAPVAAAVAWESLANRHNLHTKVCGITRVSFFSGLELQSFLQFTVRMRPGLAVICLLQWQR